MKAWGRLYLQAEDVKREQFRGSSVSQLKSTRDRGRAWKLSEQTVSPVTQAKLSAAFLVRPVPAGALSICASGENSQG